MQGVDQIKGLKVSTLCLVSCLQIVAVGTLWLRAQVILQIEGSSIQLIFKCWPHPVSLRVLLCETIGFRTNLLRIFFSPHSVLPDDIMKLFPCHVLGRG